MTDITKLKDPARVLRDMIKGKNKKARRTNITYFVGNWSDNVGMTAVGRMAMDLAKKGHCNLKQRVVGEDMTESGPVRTFEYIAEVR